MKKVISAITILFSACVIILGVLHLTRIWESPVYMAYVLLGILLLLQVIQNWKKNRAVAVFGLCAAIFVFAAAVSIFFL